MEKRWSEIQELWRNNQGLYVLAGILIGLLVFPAIEALSTDASELLSGFVPEAVGIGFTVLLIDRLYQRRAREEHKRELIRQLKSPDNILTNQAAVELRYHGWLSDGSLAGVFINGNLKDVDLSFTNLDWVHFSQANLEGVRFWKASLKLTSLVGCNLKNADFGVNTMAYQAWIDETTQLPDGTLWTPETDMTKFTDPNHPDFWEPDWVKEQREQGQQ